MTVFVTYIGIGLPVDTPSLGNLIQTGRSLMTVASLRYQLFFPVAVLVVITVSFYIIGNAFADAADPRITSDKERSQWKIKKLFSPSKI